MTPAARQAAAIDILDRWREGQSIEAVLTSWSRASRYAGSKDREAVRDLVFRAVRQWRSASVFGGGTSGRALMLGLARAEGGEPQGWTGETYTPVALSEDERARCADPIPEMTRGEHLDCPDWLLPKFGAALGAQTDATLTLMRDRAPVFARVNLAKTTVEVVIPELADEMITASAHPLAETALEITGNPRRLRNSEAYLEGFVELQDVASQAISLDFARHVPDGATVLDFCAGGGGKALALAALGLRVSAHDIAPARMRDLPSRAARAGVSISVLTDTAEGQWQAVLADAPCSGSGSWRRAPEAKWAFTPERLDELTSIQDSILSECAALTAPAGVMGYATCSLLREENEDRVNAFLSSHPDWSVVFQRRLGPLDGGDGFFLAILQRK